MRAGCRPFLPWLRGDASEKGARVHGGLLVRTEGDGLGGRLAGTLEAEAEVAGGGGEAAQG